MTINGDRIAFSSTEDVDTFYTYNNVNDGEGEFYNRFFGKEYDMNFSMYITQDLHLLKRLSLMKIVGDGNAPDIIAYGSDLVTFRDPVQQTVLPKTNIAYTLPSLTVSGTVGENFITYSGSLLLPHNGKALSKGDIITVVDTNEMLTVMGIESAKIYVDRPLTTNSVDSSVIFGSNLPARKANAVIDYGHTTVQTTTAHDGRARNIMPSGKWFDVMFTYKGRSEVKINSIISSLFEDKL
jgi:hypothetical protein